jgi:hypothetical protein
MRPGRIGLGDAPDARRATDAAEVIVSSSEPDGSSFSTGTPAAVAAAVRGRMMASISRGEFGSPTGRSR